jgi:putative methyltransferase (TIGR04325 family)
MNNAVKKYLIPLIPPLLLELTRQLLSPQVSWSGDYQHWNDAAADSAGYDCDYILAKVKSATAAVAAGKAVFERDAVLFDEIQYSWPVLAGLLAAAAKNHGDLNVLDIGGALGSSYYQNRKFLEQLNTVTWCIVEQKNFVECGKREFETEILKFFHSIEAAAEYRKFNVALLSSVLPYLEQPYVMLDDLLKLNPAMVIIDRTPVIHGDTDRLAVQKIPPEIYPASYPAWFFSETKIIEYMSARYFAPVKFDTLGGNVKLHKPRAAALTQGYIFMSKQL